MTDGHVPKPTIHPTASQQYAPGLVEAELELIDAIHDCLHRDHPGIACDQAEALAAAVLATLANPAVRPALDEWMVGRGMAWRR